MTQNITIFSWRQAITQSRLPATTRHVLLTLSLHMNDVGESCFPSIKTICDETGLTNRSVISHIAAAEAAGWLNVGVHGFAGQGWKRHEYIANVPENVVKEIHRLFQKRGEGDSPRTVKGGEPLAKGGEPNSKKVVKEVHTSSSCNSTSNTTKQCIEARTSARHAASGASSDCPPDVTGETWRDWLSLRDRKRAAVSPTVIAAARSEAQKAGMTFEAFLVEWCLRGSQGLKAAWLEPRREVRDHRLSAVERVKSANAAAGYPDDDSDYWRAQNDRIVATQ